MTTKTVPNRSQQETGFPRMVHLLDENRASEMIALCGFKMSELLGPSEEPRVDCLVCIELDKANPLGGD